MYFIAFSIYMESSPTFTEAQRAGTPCGAESAIYNVGPHVGFASLPHTKESARSLFKSEEP